MLRSFGIACLLVLLVTPAASAQQWAKKMFKTNNHDFGSVAAGAKAEFAFEFQNLYEEDVHVASVRSSCGCTSPRITKDLVKTWEKSSIVATFNTNSFRGHRSATITVVFDKPFYAEMQLTVSGYIRGDLVFEPGEVNFGDIDLAQAGLRKIQVRHSGRDDWRITDVRSANRHFEVELNEKGRGGGQVIYDMLVRLKPDAPAGHFQDQLSIITDDSQAKSVPLMVQGNVVPPVSVSPASLFLGVLAPGETVTKNLVVKAKKAFEVECIDCGDNEHLKFKSPPPGDKRNVYVIPVTFTAGDDPGQFSQKITIKTSFGDGAQCCCVATATIREASTTK